MINIKIGEQKAINFTLRVKNSKLPINLTNSKILFQLRDNLAKTEDFLLEKTITETSNPICDGQICDAENGQFVIFFKSEDTINLGLDKEYYYTIWRIFEDTKVVISSSGERVQIFNICPA